MIEQTGTDVSQLQCIYYDASHWNRLHSHAERDEIVRSFNRKKRAVFPSVVNAAELLNTPAPELRRSLCGLIASLHDRDHTILDHPEYVLQKTAKSWKSKSRSITLTESKGAHLLRSLVEKPDKFDKEIQETVTEWTETMKKETQKFRKELDVILGVEGLAGRADELINRQDFATLLYEKVPEVARSAGSAEDVFGLIQETSPWAAYAASVAYEFHLQGQDLSRQERKRQAGGPDMRQLVYLGLVHRFVTRDRGLLAAARWVAKQLPRGAKVEVLESDDYLSRTGYPFLQRKG